MSLLAILLPSAVLLAVAYRVYGGLLARLFRLDDAAPTPAVALRDDPRSFARLAPPLLALACALAAVGFARASDGLAQRPRVRTAVVAACALLHLALIGGETLLRLRDPTQRHGGGPHHEVVERDLRLCERPLVGRADRQRSHPR